MSNNKNLESREFQAEVKQLLDIVINSLYTDRQIFLRELISNAADALEKLRYHKLTDKDLADKDLPEEITIQTDDTAHTITITDTGTGMTEEELINNLGTIAHSGSKAFVKHLAEGNNKDVNLIGQFGVGFYSAFMVADKVTLYTRSYNPESKGVIWESEGTGNYTIQEMDNLQRGTKIKLHLKEDAHEFSNQDTIKNLIKQYSSFVPFSIKVNGEIVNTVKALWVKNKNEISDEEYTEFYKYIANAYDEPMFKFHFSADAPLNINALLFVPSENIEQLGFARLEPGVNLYCRKVLIQEQSDVILPEWLRFVRGVIDSEELPLNISRETMQDSALVAKLSRVITGRFLKFLKEQSDKDKEQYKKFWDKFGIFIKEGAATDFERKNDLVELLRFESSKTEEGELISIKEYLDRMKEDQKAIYYVNGQNRKIIENGPYMEIFEQNDIEVLYTYEPVDDYIFSNLNEYKDKKLQSADQADLDLPKNKESSNDNAISDEEVQSLSDWLKNILEGKVKEVKKSSRLVESPAIVLSPEGMSHSMQKMMRLMNKNMDNMGENIFEINPEHPIITKLNEIRKIDEEFAKIAAEQIYDSTLMSAGLLSEHKDMISRTYKILDRALENN